MRVASIAVAVVLMITLRGFAPEFTGQSNPPKPVPADCSRACIEGLMDQYLAALVAHDPKQLPLSADVKYTEQDQVMDVGDGFCKTVTGSAGYSHHFSDPVTGQAGWMGTMREKAGSLQPEKLPT